MFGASWNDAQEYVAWLSEKTGSAYRLMSEAEWEYVARAGTTTRYWWGDSLEWDYANCAECTDRGYGGISPTGQFPPNPFGLHDVLGNVWEWVQDCYNPGYEEAPSDGSAWEDVRTYIEPEGRW